MGLNDWIRNRILAKISPNPGVISTPTGNEDYPSFIANEGMGGSHSYRTLEELADVTKDRLVNPMLAIVKQHIRPDTSIYPTSVLRFDPSTALWNAFLSNNTYNKISDIPSYNINDYWKPALEAVPGDDGPVGPVGWSPIHGVITRDANSEVYRVVDWVNNGGADISTKPAVGSYLTNTGYTNNIALAKNIKGTKGDTGNGGQATGGTKYTQGFLQNKFSDFVAGVTNAAIPGGAFGRVYDFVQFVMPNEVNLKLYYSFAIQLTGDNSSSYDEVRLFVQRSIGPSFTTWITVPGSGNMDVIVTSESNSYFRYEGIDNNTVPGEAYRYRLIAYNTAGTNNKFSADRGNLFHLTFG